MKRHTVLRVLTQALNNSDLAIYIGRGVCEEAHSYRQHDNNLYFSDELEGLIPLATGIAMCTSKRVFVFCEDKYFIRNLSEFMQAGVSRCSNLTIVLIISGFYFTNKDMPTIFNEINSQHGVMFNLNLLVHDYTKIFKMNKNPLKHIKQFWARTKGPIAIILHVDLPNKDDSDFIFSDYMSIIQTKKFIQDKSIEVQDFVPPISLEELNLGE